jgi:hypothetical protein
MTIAHVLTAWVRAGTRGRPETKSSFDPAKSWMRNREITRAAGMGSATSTFNRLTMSECRKESQP